MNRLTKAQTDSIRSRYYALKNRYTETDYQAPETFKLEPLNFHEDTGYWDNDTDSADYHQLIDDLAETFDVDAGTVEYIITSDCVHTLDVDIQAHNEIDDKCLCQRCEEPQVDLATRAEVRQFGIRYDVSDYQRLCYRCAGEVREQSERMADNCEV